MTNESKDSLWKIIADWMPKASFNDRAGLLHVIETHVDSLLAEQKRLILEEVEKEKWKNDDGTPMTQEDSQVLGYDNNIISNLQDKIKKI